jgi:cysteine desulfurase family protein
LIYFDNAATTFPKPPAVVQAANDALRFYGGNPGRSGHRMSMAVSEKVYDVRRKAGAFFGAEPENVIFTLNCTHALNIALQGVMAEGGHIIASCLDHNAVLRPLEAMAQKGQISYSVADVIESDPEKTLDNFACLICPDTKAIVCTHASNVTGTLLPVEKLGQLCRERGLLFILDAAQTAGTLPVKLSMGPDIICTAGHKGLLAAPGTGLLVLRPGLALPPLMQGGTGSNSLELLQPDFAPDRYEPGTLNTVGVLSLGAGLLEISRRGVPRIYHHEMALCTRVYEELSRMPGVSLLAQSFKLGEKAPIVSFNLNKLDSNTVASRLSEQGFALRGGFHCAALAHPYLGTQQQGAVRFSPGVFNTPREVEMFLSTVRKIAQGQ